MTCTIILQRHVSLLFCQHASNKGGTRRSNIFAIPVVMFETTHHSGTAS
jgi:hypothetical protein